MEIVVAELEDLDDLSQLFEEYRQFYGEKSDFGGGKSFLQQRLSNQESYCWLAIVDEQPVGFMQLYPLYSSLNLSSQWVLNDVYVRPDARRQGVAQALLEEAIIFARGTESKGLLLETAADNLIAQRLYAKIGFVREKNYHYFYSTTVNDK